MRTILTISGADSPIPAERFAPPGGAGVRIVQASRGSDPAAARALIEDELPRADAVILHGFGHAADAGFNADAGMSAEAIGRARRLAIIVHAGAGSGGVDLEAARRAGIYVASVPDAATAAHADLVVETIRALTRMVESEGRLRIPELGRPPRVGLVGLGCVGRAVAARLGAAGAEIWAADPFVTPETFRAADARNVPLDDLLGACDVVSLSVPLCADTRGLINHRALSLMRPTACLVNTAAPELIEFEELIRALEEGRIRGSACTVATDAGMANAGAGEVLPRDGVTGGALAGGAMDATLAARVEALERVGSLRPLRPDFDRDPAVRETALRSALRAALECLQGRPPDHLLIDPPLPRALTPGF